MMERSSRDKTSRILSVLYWGKVYFLCIVCFEAIIFILYFINDHFIVSKIDARVSADGFENKAWALHYFDEFEACNSMQWYPYIYWHRKPCSGKYINVQENGLRFTYNQIFQEDHDSKVIQIWIFGGSSIWGTGVQDSDTIPSFISKYITAQGLAAEVTNYGESGYVSTQELVHLIVELQKMKSPDFVVFFDGFNDSFSAYSNQIAGIPNNEWRRRSEFMSSEEKSYVKSIKQVIKSMAIFRLASSIRSSVGRLIDRRRNDDKIIKRNAILIDDVVDLYFQNIQIIQALGEKYNFHTIFLWQPTLYTKKNRTLYEEKYLEEFNLKYPNLEIFTRAINDRVRLRISRGSSPFIQDMTGFFDGFAKPAYIDYCHTTSIANQMIAEYIGRNIMSITSFSADHLD